MKKKKRGKKSGRLPKFRYQPRSQEQMRKQKNRSTGNYDVAYKDDFKLYKPKEGGNKIRILPPTHENPEHFGIDVFLHSNIGPDNQTYLCHRQTQGGEGKCPICDEYARAKRSGDDKYADDIRSYLKVLVWLIDRNEPEKGPQLYALPITLNKAIMGAAEDPDTKEILVVDHPDEGYDLVFEREGSGLKTRYQAVKVSRHPSPVSDDDRQYEEWLDFIAENPLPSVLNFYDLDYIEEVFSGAASSRDPEEDADDDESETNEYDEREEPEDEIDDPDEDLDGGEDDDVGDDPPGPGDRVSVEIDGDSYEGRVESCEDGEAFVVFDDGDEASFPYGEIEIVERAKKPRLSKKKKTKKKSIRQRVREHMKD